MVVKGGRAPLGSPTGPGTRRLAGAGCMACPPSGCLALCLPRCPSPTGRFLLPLFSQTALSTCLLPPLPRVPASMMLFVSVCPAGALSPEASTRGRRPHTLPGSSTCGPHTHAPPCNSAQWPRWHLARAPGCCLHPCLGTGPQTHWRVPAAQRSDSDRPLG